MLIEKLRAFQAFSPFKDYFGTVLDLDGPWTQELSDADANNDLRHGDLNEPTRSLAVWEGSCEIAIEDEGTEDEHREYKFKGSWRQPTIEELFNLARGLTPLRGLPVHTLDLRLSVGEAFEIERVVDAFMK